MNSQQSTYQYLPILKRKPNKEGKILKVRSQKYTAKENLLTLLKSAIDHNKPVVSFNKV